MSPEDQNQPQNTTVAPAQPMPAQPDPSVAPELQPVQPQPVSPAPSAPGVATPPKKHFLKWILIVGGIVVAAIIALVITIFFVTIAATKAPQKVSDQVVNAIQAGNTSAVYNLTSDSFKRVTTEDRLNGIVEQISPALQGEEKVTGRAIEKVSGNPPTAVIVYTIDTSKGKAYMKVELQKSDDVWQVINFRSSEKPLKTEVE